MPAQTVSLSNGQTLTVHPVPPFAMTAIARSLPANTPEAQAARERLMQEAAWLMALPGVSVPQDWAFPRGLSYAGIQSREGDEGRLLDYIEYGLLLTPADIQSVQVAMYGTALTEDDIGAAEDTFPADGGRDTALPDPVAAG